MFFTLAISAGAFFAIGSSSPILSDNYEALTSGDPNDNNKEIECWYSGGHSEMEGTVRDKDTGNCIYKYPYCFDMDNNPTCIPVNP